MQQNSISNLDGLKIGDKLDVSVARQRDVVGKVDQVAETRSEGLFEEENLSSRCLLHKPLHEIGGLKQFVGSFLNPLGSGRK